MSVSSLPTQSTETAPLLVLEKVLTQSALKREWYPLLLEIFPDKDDQSPLPELLGMLKDDTKNTFYLLRDAKTGKAVGMELRQVDPAIPGSMYLPRAGVIPLAPQELARGGEERGVKLSDRRSVHERAFLGKVSAKKPRIFSVKVLKVGE